MTQFKFGSVCSGIEAASVAWNPLGWQAAWFSEIEPLPCAVLAHHYPEVPNLGDMTTLPGRIAAGEVEAPDLFCGGTPCQAFSVAGLRKSLDDARGNLSLVFCEIANAIDSARASAGLEPGIVFWENVPGVLNTKDNAFGCFLAGLAGEDLPLEPPRGRWTNAGAVFGPKRAIAWRILDAQYFGVAQRRRRVFVVASARRGFDVAGILFEWERGRRDFAPGREIQKGGASTIAVGAEGAEGDSKELIAFFSAGSGCATLELSPTLRATGANSMAALFPDGRCRKFTAEECERLQGFDVGYTNLPGRKNFASSRRKMIGNSWPVPVVRWIGQRIADELRKEN